jgi:hypothetical protein
VYSLLFFSSMALDVFSLLQVNASAVWPGLRAAAAATRCPFRIKMLMRKLQVHEAVNLTASRHVKVISLSLSLNHQHSFFFPHHHHRRRKEKDKNETSPSIDPSSLACHLTPARPGRWASSSPVAAVHIGTAN